MLDAPSVQELENLIYPKLEGQERPASPPAVRDTIDCRAAKLPKLPDETSVQPAAEERLKEAAQPQTVQPAEKHAGKAVALPPKPASPPVAKPVIQGPRIAARPAPPRSATPPARPLPPPQKHPSADWRAGLSREDIEIGEIVLKVLQKAVVEQHQYPQAQRFSPQGEKSEKWKAQVVSRLHDLLFGEPVSTWTLTHGGMGNAINKVRADLIDLFGGERNLPQLPDFMRGRRR